LKGASVDDLLEAVSTSSEKLRVCAEGMMDDIIVNTHKTMNDDFEMTKHIRTMAENTGGEVDELQGKVDEILRRQKSIQQTLDAISGKNGLLDFLKEYLSMCPKLPNT
jgi:division protein CdvB (Snf7/Vps24/ESCRT-III family)